MAGLFSPAENPPNGVGAAVVAENANKGAVVTLGLAVSVATGVVVAAPNEKRGLVSPKAAGTVTASFFSTTGTV